MTNIIKKPEPAYDEEQIQAIEDINKILHINSESEQRAKAAECGFNEQQFNEIFGEG